MSEVPLTYLPGICKVESAYAAGKEGRYIDGDKIRFVAGRPEKIGGRTTMFSGTTTGVPRGLLDWQDLNQNKRIAVGTNQKLYYTDGTAFTDITPFRWITTGSLSSPFTTTNGSKTVSVAHTAHGLSSNDVVELTGGAAVGGVTVAGVYVITVTDANDYTITVSSTATSSVSGGGGTTPYSYTRVTLSGPFATTNGSAVVTVTHNAHGAVNGDFVEIAGASAVGGITLSGEYVIANATTNTYTVTASSAANATTTGGGSPTFQYDLSIGLADSAAGVGFGVGTYGSGTYGTSQQTSLILLARTWTFGAYGQQLLANPAGGTIYVYDPTIGNRANALYGAPSSVNAMFLTPERYVIALGAGDPLTVAWPDQSDDTAWTATTTNTANSGRKVAGGSKLLGGAAVKAGVNILCTDTTAFTHLYTGDNYVFDTRAAANGSGLAGALAICVLNSKAFWMSDADFWFYDGVVQGLPSSDIRDYVFKNINLEQRAKFVARPVRLKNEVHFHYASASSTENDRYVIWHDDQQCWSIGTDQRTCGIDQGLFRYPIACDASGNIYNHEFGTDDNGAAMNSYIIGGPQDISSGDVKMDIFGFIPDAERQTGNLTLNVLTRFYPNDPDTVDGPYTLAADDSTPRIDLRSDGKMAGFKIESNVIGGDFRLGLMRADVQPGGARR